MVRHPAYRLRKYEAKIDADVIKARILAHKDAMVEQEEAVMGKYTLIEQKAKTVCEAAGIPTPAIPSYLNFARQCNKISENFSQVTRTNEIQTAFNKWVSRGLNATVLASIASLCGTAIPGY